jgi:hypothetical protein
MPECAGWERVIVVRDRGFRVTTVDLPYDLELESVDVVARLGLSFAAVSWGIPVDRGRPILAKINPYPSMYETAPVWSDVCRALLHALLAT